MIVPILHKTNVVVIFSSVPEHHSDLAAKRIEDLLLVQLALEGQMHAFVVFFDQIVEALLCLLVLFTHDLIAGLQFFQFSDLLAHELYLFLQKSFVFC